MKDELISGTIGTTLSAIGTALQTEQVLRIIALVITLIGAILTYIIMPLINWYKKAKEDGKITKEELKEGTKIIIDGSQSVKDKIEETKQLDKREEIEQKKGQ